MGWVCLLCFTVLLVCCLHYVCLAVRLFLLMYYVCLMCFNVYVTCSDLICISHVMCMSLPVSLYISCDLALFVLPWFRRVFIVIVICL